MKNFSVLLITLLITSGFAMAELTKADKVIESVADKAEEITDTTIYNVQSGAQFLKDKSLETQENTKNSITKVKEETVKRANKVSNSAARSVKRAAEKVQYSADKTIEKTDKTINEINETELK